MYNVNTTLKLNIAPKRMQHAVLLPVCPSPFSSILSINGFVSRATTNLTQTCPVILNPLPSLFGALGKFVYCSYLENTDYFFHYTIFFAPSFHFLKLFCSCSLPVWCTFLLIPLASEKQRKVETAQLPSSFHLHRNSQGQVRPLERTARDRYGPSQEQLGIGTALARTATDRYGPSQEQLGDRYSPSQEQLQGQVRPLTRKKTARHLN